VKVNQNTMIMARFYKPTYTNKSPPLMLKMHYNLIFV